MTDMPALTQTMIATLEEVATQHPVYRGCRIAAGEPASEAQLVELEALLGARLPPSYRAFLSLHDGMRFVDDYGEDYLFTIYTVAQLMAPADDEEGPWDQPLFADGELERRNVLAIGRTYVTGIMYYLDRSAPGVDGEWPAVKWHASGADDPLASFAELMRAEIADIRTLIPPA